MGDIGKGSAVDDRRVVFQRLHQVGLEGVLEQHGHGAVGFQVARGDGFLVLGITDDNVAEPFSQVFHRGREAEDRHDFRSHNNVEAVLARVTVGRAAERAGDVAQGTVVHVHHALPGDAAHVDVQFVAVVDVVVQHRGQQVVGQGDGGKVAGKVEIDVFHGYDLRVAATGSTALHAEDRAKRGLAQADDCLLADAVKRVSQADGRRGLAFAGRCGADGRDENQFSIRAVFQAVHIIERNLRLEVAIGFEVFVTDAEFILGDFGNTLQCRLLGDFDIGCHVFLSSRNIVSVDSGWSTASQRIRIARKSFTLVSVGPVTSRSPILAKKL